MAHSGPVHHREDGTWWFWEETGSDRMGPYPTRAAAQEHLRRYAHYYLEGRNWRPRPGEFARRTLDDLTTEICLVDGPHPQSGIIWFVTRFLSGEVVDVDEMTLDPVSPLEALTVLAHSDLP